jgi:thiol-disulfide isomerase/thioredoxin
MRKTLLALAFAALTGAAAADDGGFSLVAPREAGSADVEVVNKAGDTHILADFLPGEPSVLHFWATWCAPCRAELPGLAAYADELGERGLRDRLIVVAVEPSPREKIDRFLTEIGLEGFVTLQDRQNRSGATFGLFGMPATILLDAGGRVVGQHSGPIDWTDETVREELAAHLDG